MKPMVRILPLLLTSGYIFAQDTLVGLWGSEQVPGPKLRGTLTIRSSGDRWRAYIGSTSLPAERVNDVVRFHSVEGEFQGRVSADLKTIAGEWIQPPGIVFNNAYTSPVQLQSSGAGVWKGQIAPLDERVSFFISIQNDSGTTLSAFIRNPEFNTFRRRAYRVETKGAEVVFVNPRNSKDVIRGTHNSQTNRLSIPLLESDLPIAFTHLSDKDATGFLPRVPVISHYVYHQPSGSDDGWRSGSLAEVGMNSGPISALMDKILNADQADNPVYIQSLLIARHGRLVLEEYFYGFDRERPHDMRSASKTFAPVLVGIARDQGFKISPQTPITALFPQYKPFGRWDDRKSAITLAHLMTMTSGLACDDNDDSSPGNENTMQAQAVQPDWYRYTLDLPLVRDPGGEQATYCSASLNLVGGAVRSAIAAPLPQFFEQYLARPLQFHNYHLNLTPTGDTYMGGGLYLRPRDELKLGQLYLNGGVWNGKRVVSATWVSDSITPHSKFNPQMDFDIDHQYGYGWHNNPLKANGRIYQSYSAGGNGGQIVMVVPELDLVVAFNGGSYGEFSKWYRWGLQLVPEYIIAAIGDK